MKRLMDQKVVASDTETDGLHVHKGNRICGFSFSALDGFNFYVPVRHINQKNLEGGVQAVDDFFRDFLGWVGFHNGKFDLMMFSADNVRFPKHIDDTILMAHLLLQDNHQGQLGLKKLCKTELGEEPEDQTALMDHLARFVDPNKKKKEDPPMAHIAEGNIEIVGQYAQTDTRFTLALHTKMRERIRKTCENLYQLEVELMQHLTKTELRGVLLDVTRLVELRDKARVDLDKLLDEIRDETQVPTFNPRSPSQLAGLLWDVLSLEKPVDATTAKGNVSVDDDVLSRYDHPLVTKIRDYRKLSTIYKTFLVGLTEHLSDQNQIHCNFNQVGTTSGRFSSSRPNLQNIPRGDKGAVREVFICRPDFTSYRYDYSQIEYRLFAHYCQDPTLIKGYVDDASFDIHQQIADELGIPRPGAKNVNFASVYGAGIKKLAMMTGWSTSQSRTFLARYHAAHPGIASLQQSVKTVLSQRIIRRDGAIVSHGYVKDAFGRVYYVPLDKSYVGVNRLIQGCAASLLKTAMVAVYNYLDQISAERGFRVGQILNLIHDELDIELSDKLEDQEKVALKIKDIMEDFPQFKVPILVDMKQSKTNWAEAVDWPSKEQNG